MRGGELDFAFRTLFPSNQRFATPFIQVNGNITKHIGSHRCCRARLVQQLTQRGVCVGLLKQALNFTGEDAPMSQLLLEMTGTFAEFPRALIRERQREGIAPAKKTW